MNNVLPDELWDKYDDEWVNTGRENTAYLVMLLGEERFPHLPLDEAANDPYVPPGDHIPFYDHIDDVLRDLYIRRAFAKDTPLTHHDYCQIALNANAVLGERHGV